MKALVTGAGQLAIEIAAVLLARGYEVAVLTRGRTSRHQLIKAPGAVEVYFVDIRDSAAVKQTFMEVRPDIVVHTAAMSAVSTCCENPEGAFLTNTIGTKNVLDASVLTNVRVFVHISTDKVIGATESPANEDSPYDPGPEPYSVSKTAAEMVALKLYENRLPVLVVRPCNMLGKDLDFSRVAPKTFQRALERQPLTVYRTSAEVLREYIDARDVALAIADLVELRIQGKLEHAVYHVGSGVRLTAMEMVRRIAKVAGLDPDECKLVDPPESLRAVELGSQWIDSTRLRKALPLWSPRPIDESLQDCYEFYRHHFTQSFHLVQPTRTWATIQETA